MQETYKGLQGLIFLSNDIRWSTHIQDAELQLVCLFLSAENRVDSVLQWINSRDRSAAAKAVDVCVVRKMGLPLCCD